MASNWSVEVSEKKFLSIYESLENDKKYTFFIRLNNIFGVEKYYEAENRYCLKIYSAYSAAHGCLVFSNPIDRNIIYDRIIEVLRIG